mmetsp:Transcript_1208/g.3870  ORF Transcript_1208/g.3870 Transcript_1208/m.3870 type:complete len:120 (-) Transcript_1208:59-418(-)
MEAHTSDHWRLGSLLSIHRQHQSLAERKAAARAFRDKFAWTSELPMAVDTMSNGFHHAFAVWPERLVIVLDGRIAYLQVGKPGGDVDKWTMEAEQWLEAFRDREAGGSSTAAALQAAGT